MVGWMNSVLLVAFVHFSYTTVKCESPKNAADKSYPFRNVSLPWDVRVDDIVNRLTLEDIQLMMARGGGRGGIDGPAPAIPRLGIGPYEWATECLRGDAYAPGNGTAFPQAIGLAAAFSPELIFRMAEATAEEVRGKHNDYVKKGQTPYHAGASCYSPVINIMRDSRWGRNQETYGEDPYLSGVHATAYIQGLQGNDTRYVRASGACKHFDVHGGPENIPVSRSSFNAVVSEEDWRMTFLPAFRACVKAGTYGLMCSYNRVNGVPACANKKLLTDILRTEWGFKGWVISDGGAIENIIHAHHYLNNSVDTVAAAVNAGCNLEDDNTWKDPVFMSLEQAVTEGKVTEDTVKERVRPLFYTRMRLGEFDPPEMNPYSKLSNADVETPEHKALALEAAMKSFVLLKNNGVLPLNTSRFRTYGFVGPFATNASQLMGDYAPHVPQYQIITPYRGLQSLAKMVQFAPGCLDTECVRYTAYDSQAVIETINNTDINFVFLGTGLAVEREAHDRPDTELPGHQKQILLDVINNNPASTPLVLVLFNAGPVNISFADLDPRVSAILECFFPATVTGDALRHVLINDVKGAVPAGRLPYTWPMLASQLPPMVNYSMQGRTYRYFEGEPLYPFGYGLSYTRFSYADFSCTQNITAGQSVTGTVTVKNTGKYDADEVAQIYIRWTDTSLPAPKIQLAWFKRVTIAANEQVQLSFEVEARTMAVWINDGWHIKSGMMDIMVGGQQPFTKRAVPGEGIVSRFNISGSKYLGRA
ncbi:uncharacterized protein [Littorina saxatilis]|uniref:Fibronectin type III-like domain-containing protein n=1 Tax=Littorina saxatilis TaxID=31220 RepID=A0AAN9GJ09_9CAEN